jgi:hypothetical protein
MMFFLVAELDLCVSISASKQGMSRGSREEKVL